MQPTLTVKKIHALEIPTHTPPPCEISNGLPLKWSAPKLVQFWDDFICKCRLVQTSYENCQVQKMQNYNKTYSKNSEY